MCLNNGVQISFKEGFLVNGGGCGKLVEQGLTANEVFSMVWLVPRADRDEVLSMSASGVSRNAISKHFGCARSTISRILSSVDT